MKGLPASAAIEGTESATGEEPITGAEPTETSPLQIDAIAQQWLWRFEYPGGQPGQRTFTYGELVVPVDTTVILDITSTDVLHLVGAGAQGPGAGGAGRRHADVVQGRRGGSLRAARPSSPAPAIP